MAEKYFWKKITAIFLIFVFIPSGFVCPAPPITIAPSDSQEVSFSSLLENIEIPSALGSIENRTAPAIRFNSSPTTPSFSIVYLQDPHAQYSAQANMKEIINHLYEQYGFDFIFIEGGIGKLDPNLLKFFKSDEANLKTAAMLAEDGVLGGPELFLLDQSLKKNAKPVLAYGVEDPDLYRENLRLFREVYKHQNFSTFFLSKIKLALEDEASKVFSRELKSFFREWLSFQDQHAELVRHLNTLQRYAKEVLHIDLSDPRQQRDWPQLLRFVKIGELEKDLDPAAAQRDAAKLREWIKAKNLNAYLEGIDKIQIKDSSYFKHETPRSFLEELYKHASALGFSFKQFPDWSKAASLFLLQTEMDSARFFSEIEKLNNLLLSQLVKTQGEGAVLDRFKKFILLEKLFSLALMPPEYERILNQKKNWSPSLLFQTYGDKFGEMKASPDQVFHFADSLFERTMEFYAMAKQREQSIAAQVLKRMREEHKSKAILVAGGFHTGGIRTFLQNSGAGVLTISPQMNTLDEKNNYEKVMLGQKDSFTLISHLRYVSRIDPLSVTSQLGPAEPGYVAYGINSALGRVLSQEPDRSENRLEELNQGEAFRRNGLRYLKTKMGSKPAGILYFNQTPVKFEGKWIGIGTNGPIWMNPRSEIRTVISGPESEIFQRAYDTAQKALQETGSGNLQQVFAELGNAVDGFKDLLNRGPSPPVRLITRINLQRLEPKRVALQSQLEENQRLKQKEKIRKSVFLALLFNNQKLEEATPELLARAVEVLEIAPREKDEIESNAKKLIEMQAGGFGLVEEAFGQFLQQLIEDGISIDETTLSLNLPDDLKSQFAKIEELFSFPEQLHDLPTRTIDLKEDYPDENEIKIIQFYFALVEYRRLSSETTSENVDLRPSLAELAQALKNPEPDLEKRIADLGEKISGENMKIRFEFREDKKESRLERLEIYKINMLSKKLPIEIRVLDESQVIPTGKGPAGRMIERQGEVPEELFNEAVQFFKKMHSRVDQIWRLYYLPLRLLPELRDFFTARILAGISLKPDEEVMLPEDKIKIVRIYNLIRRREFAWKVYNMLYWGEKLPEDLLLQILTDDHKYFLRFLYRIPNFYDEYGFSSNQGFRDAVEKLIQEETDYKGADLRLKKAGEKFFQSLDALSSPGTAQNIFKKFLSQLEDTVKAHYGETKIQGPLQTFLAHSFDFLQKQTEEYKRENQNLSADLVNAEIQRRIAVPLGQPLQQFRTRIENLILIPAEQTPAPEGGAQPAYFLIEEMLKAGEITQLQAKILGLAVQGRQIPEDLTQLSGVLRGPEKEVKMAFLGITTDQFQWVVLRVLADYIRSLEWKTDIIDWVARKNRETAKSLFKDAKNLMREMLNEAGIRNQDRLALQGLVMSPAAFLTEIFRSGDEGPDELIKKLLEVSSTLESAEGLQHRIRDILRNPALALFREKIPAKGPFLSDIEKLQKWLGNEFQIQDFYAYLWMKGYRFSAEGKLLKVIEKNFLEEAAARQKALQEQEKRRQEESQERINSRIRYFFANDRSNNFEEFKTKLFEHMKEVSESERQEFARFFDKSIEKYTQERIESLQLDALAFALKRAYENLTTLKLNIHPGHLGRYAKEYLERPLTVEELLAIPKKVPLINKILPPTIQISYEQKAAAPHATFEQAEALFQTAVPKIMYLIKAYYGAFEENGGIPPTKDQIIKKAKEMRLGGEDSRRKMGNEFDDLVAQINTTFSKAVENINRPSGYAPLRIAPALIEPKINQIFRAWRAFRKETENSPFKFEVLQQKAAIPQENLREWAEYLSSETSKMEEQIHWISMRWPDFEKDFEELCFDALDALSKIKERGRKEEALSAAEAKDYSQEEIGTFVKTLREFVRGPELVELLMGPENFLDELRNALDPSKAQKPLLLALTKAQLNENDLRLACLYWEIRKGNRKDVLLQLKTALEKIYERTKDSPGMSEEVKRRLHHTTKAQILESLDRLNTFLGEPVYVTDRTTFLTTKWEEKDTVIARAYQEQLKYPPLSYENFIASTKAEVLKTKDFKTDAELAALEFDLRLKWKLKLDKADWIVLRFYWQHRNDRLSFQDFEDQLDASDKNEEIQQILEEGLDKRIKSINEVFMQFPEGIQIQFEEENAENADQKKITGIKGTLPDYYVALGISLPANPTMQTMPRRHELIKGLAAMKLRDPETSKAAREAYEILRGISRKKISITYQLADGTKEERLEVLTKRLYGQLYIAGFVTRSEVRGGNQIQEDLGTHSWNKARGLVLKAVANREVVKFSLISREALERNEGMFWVDPSSYRNLGYQLNLLYKYEVLEHIRTAKKSKPEAPGPEDYQFQVLKIKEPESALIIVYGPKRSEVRMPATGTSAGAGPRVQAENLIAEGRYAEAFKVLLKPWQESSKILKDPAAPGTKRLVAGINYRAIEPLMQKIKEHFRKESQKRNQELKLAALIAGTALRWNLAAEMLQEALRLLNVIDKCKTLFLSHLNRFHQTLQEKGSLAADRAALSKQLGIEIPEDFENQVRTLQDALDPLSALSFEEKIFLAVYFQLENGTEKTNGSLQTILTQFRIPAEKIEESLTLAKRMLRLVAPDSEEIIPLEDAEIVPLFDSLGIQSDVDLNWMIPSRLLKEADRIKLRLFPKASAEDKPAGSTAKTFRRQLWNSEEEQKEWEATRPAVQKALVDLSRELAENFQKKPPEVMQPPALKTQEDDGQIVGSEAYFLSSIREYRWHYKMGHMVSASFRNFDRYSLLDRQVKSASYLGLLELVKDVIAFRIKKGYETLDRDRSYSWMEESMKDSAPKIEQMIDAYRSVYFRDIKHKVSAANFASQLGETGLDLLTIFKKAAVAAQMQEREDEPQNRDREIHDLVWDIDFTAKNLSKSLVFEDQPPFTVRQNLTLSEAATRDANLKRNLEAYQRAFYKLGKRNGAETALVQDDFGMELGFGNNGGYAPLHNLKNKLALIGETLDKIVGDAIPLPYRMEEKHQEKGGNLNEENFRQLIRSYRTVHKEEQENAQQEGRPLRNDENDALILKWATSVKKLKVNDLVQAKPLWKIFKDTLVQLGYKPEDLLPGVIPATRKEGVRAASPTATAGATIDPRKKLIEVDKLNEKMAGDLIAFHDEMHEKDSKYRFDIEQLVQWLKQSVALQNDPDLAWSQLQNSSFIHGLWTNANGDSQQDAYHAVTAILSKKYGQYRRDNPAIEDLDVIPLLRLREVLYANIDENENRDIKAASIDFLFRIVDFVLNIPIHATEQSAARGKSAENIYARRLAKVRGIIKNFRHPVRSGDLSFLENTIRHPRAPNRSELRLATTVARNAKWIFSEDEVLKNGGRLIARISLPTDEGESAEEEILRKARQAVLNELGHPVLQPVSIALVLPAKLQEKLGRPFLQGLAEGLEDSNLREILRNRNKLFRPFEEAIQKRNKGRVTLRDVRLDQGNILLTDQPKVPLVLIQNTGEKVHSMFLPFWIEQMEELKEDSPALRFLGKMTGRALIHAADIFSDPKFKMITADELKQELLRRLQKEDFPDLLTVVEGSKPRLSLNAAIARKIYSQLIQSKVTAFSA